MSKSISLGGDRLGSGKKDNIKLHGYGRSTHDLGYIWRSSMAAGTLVPFMNLVGLPGDTFDIDLDLDVKTLPTIGPLFGSYKAQLDVFVCPVRLYQGQLHNNKLGIGLKMSDIKLPMIREKSLPINDNLDKPIELQQHSSSSLLAYLGIRGLGYNVDYETEITRYFNGVPFLSYWDIYKNYYSNKQEELGVFIHTENGFDLNFVSPIDIYNPQGSGNISVNGDGTFPNGPQGISYGDVWTLKWDKTNSYNNIQVELTDNPGIWFYLEAIGNVSVVSDYEINWAYENSPPTQINRLRFEVRGFTNDEITLSTFDLNNIDKMRENLLAHTKNASPYILDENSISPYGSIIGQSDNEYPRSQFVQEGLAIKTYQSDIFNNWLNSESIDGANGIAAVTAVDTSSGSFTMDTLNLSKKVYDMLNRINVSGGTYNDWMEAVYDVKTFGRAESPMYMGGLSSEVIFQEVVSNAAAKNEKNEQEPLGTLAGKGRSSNKRKGGRVHIKCHEPSYIMGIVSLTPRIDYSQGNDWDVNIKTMDDFHKPQLDEIGFQDLLTDQIAFWDTLVNDDGSGIIQTKSAGKQPAWLNYMTNYNKTFGNFADPNKEMFMTLNRKYDRVGHTIGDLTTYIDPSKYNEIFADSDLSSQNFWMQISADITARRIMSAKLMPNL